VSEDGYKVYISDASDVRPWLAYRGFPKVNNEQKYYGWRASGKMFEEIDRSGGISIDLKRTYAGMEASKIDFLSNRGSGRILEYDVYSKNMIVLMAKLNFPNGMVIKKSEAGKTTLIFSETLRSRVLEVDIISAEYS
jgi:hypothetical protein